MAAIWRDGEVVVTRRGEPVACLVAVGARLPRKFGADRGRLVVPPDFDAPLTDDVLATFEH